MSDGVVDQDPEEPRQQVRVPVDDGRAVAREADVPPGDGPIRGPRHGQGDARDVDGPSLGRRPRIGPGKREQAVHEAGHPGGLGGDVGERLRPIDRGDVRMLRQELRVGPDGRERGAELVRRVGGEPSLGGQGRRLPSLGGRDVIEHGVEARGQDADLVLRACRREPAGQVAGLADLVDRDRQRPEWPQRPTHDQVRDDRDRDHGDEARQHQEGGQARHLLLGERGRLARGDHARQAVRRSGERGGGDLDLETGRDREGGGGPARL